ncbi:hypothetical protein [Stackebrandtia soli]|uniref:hypothetical protein n=1 Tax=Stackebrandtia soli TaxID=1892856 RepID=UPI0039EB989D
MRVALLAASLATVIVVAPAAPASAEDSCTSGVANDFDGDGVRDLAISDPRATVNDRASAGRVHIVYGDGATQTMTQSDPFFPGYAAEVGDQFGYALASTDWNGDGCSDLVISSPFESLDAANRAGMASIVFGSPTGLGAAGTLNFYANTAPFTATDPTNDQFGYSLAAGKTASGEPYVVFGIPGRELVKPDGSVLEQAGAVAYARGSQRTVTHQDSSGVFGIAEAGDLFGYSVAAAGRHIAVGGHGEDVGGEPYSGTVAVLEHTISAGAQVAVGGIDQTAPGDTGVPGADDWYGRTLAMVDYLDTAGVPQSLLIVGVPGEDSSDGTVPDVGRLVTVSPTGTVTELDSVNQDSPGVDGGSEVEDLFGWSVSAVNRDPVNLVTWDDLLFVAGSPGEDVGAFIDAGGIQVFSAIGAPGDHDVTVSASYLAGAGFVEVSDRRLGQFVHATPDLLYIADPRSADPAVYGVPWNNLLFGATLPVVAYRPGQNGLPSDGVGLFGAALA